MPIVEFISKITRFSRNRYMIEIPKALRPLAEQLHRLDLKVVLLEPDEEIYPVIEPVWERDAEGEEVLAGWMCSDGTQKQLFVQYMPHVQRQLAEVFSVVKQPVPLQLFLQHLARAITKTNDETIRKTLAATLERLAQFCIY